MNPDYDVIVSGARVAGTPTAMLLARAGLRVLVLERVRHGTDTSSTHALMKGAVVQLRRWGVLEDVIAAGTPEISRSRVTYGDDALDLELRPTPDGDFLYAPRRTVLDPILATAAMEAGAEVRYETSLADLIRDRTGRVTGVVARDKYDGTFEACARMVVGADGMSSRVARLVGAPYTRIGRGASALIYGYWRDVPTNGYEWYFRRNATAGIIPTNDGEVCAWVGAPADAVRDELRTDVLATFRRLLREAAPEAVNRIEGAPPASPLRSFPGRAGYLRRPWGEGWALVGDAGYFKDPLSAHGITDALRDAELLARAVIDGLGGGSAEREALAAYEQERDRLSLRLFDAIDRVAGYGWDTSSVQPLMLEVSRAMGEEAATLAALPRVEQVAA